jgi:DNA-binding response OmpR family regulator
MTRRFAAASSTACGPQDMSPPPRRGGDEGLDLALTGNFDLMLLDLVLPGNTGWNILRVVRASKSNLPIIVLTACGAEEQRVEGLRMGADDYVVKPFSLRELLARVEAVLRRVPAAAPLGNTVRFSGGAVDLDQQILTRTDGERVVLSDKESAVLMYLAANAGQIVSREQLLAGVWGLDPQGINTRTVDMHITRLREKLGDNAAAPRIVSTVWGRGYRFEAVRESSP